MRPKHLPEIGFFDKLEFSEDSPLPILFSGCLAEAMCGYDGTNFGEYTYMRAIIAHPAIKAVPFCPEEFSFGAPRDICDIVGGDGFDVLEGNARVITDKGDDWTDKMIIAANWMAGYAQDNNVKCAILMDTSAACGSQVIYDGARSKKNYQIGMGVCAARLHQAGIPILSQRDFVTMKPLLDRLGIAIEEGDDGNDHHQREWYKDYFKTS